MIKCIVEIRSSENYFPQVFLVKFIVRSYLQKNTF